MKKKRVIFVCLGNICRSPAAEGVMKSLIEKEGLEKLIEVDSAGTIAYHAGEKADARMRKHALNRGYNLTSIARKFSEQDFDEFDYIVTMDLENFVNVSELDIDHKYADKIFKMTYFLTDIIAEEVPDPYYGGAAGFEHVLDILEDACKGLLEKIKDDISKENIGQD